LWDGLLGLIRRLPPAMSQLECSNPAFHDPVKAFRITKFKNAAAQ